MSDSLEFYVPSEDRTYTFIQLANDFYEKIHENKTYSIIKKYKKKFPKKFQTPFTILWEEFLVLILNENEFMNKKTSAGEFI